MTKNILILIFVFLPNENVSSNDTLHEESYFIPDEQDVITIKHEGNKYVKDYLPGQFQHKNYGGFEEITRGDENDEEGVQVGNHNRGSTHTKQQDADRDNQFYLDSSKNNQTDEGKLQEKYDKLLKGFHDSYELNEYKSKKKYWQKGDKLGEFLKFGRDRGKLYTNNEDTTSDYPNAEITERESTTGGEHSHGRKVTWIVEGSPLSDLHFKMRSPAARDQLEGE